MIPTGALSDGVLDREPPRFGWELLGLWLVLLYFGSRIAAYALWLHPFVPPDEVDLFRRTLIFGSTLGVPADSSLTADIGLIRTTPPIYFWLMARALSFNVFGIPDLLFARFVNVGISLVSAFLVYLVGKEIGLEPRLRLLSVVIFTNTLQISMLSATVTYDNLVSLLCFAMLVPWLSLLRSFAPRRFLWFLLFAGLASLTKVSALPLFALAVLLLACFRWKSAARDLAALVAEVRLGRRSSRGLACAALVGLLGAGYLYGGNLVRYGTVLPHPLQVLPLEDALQNRLIRRDWVVDEFRSGRLSFEEARRELAKISNQGNRSRGLRLLALAADPEQLAESRVSAPAYLLEWVRIMSDRLLGFQGNGQFSIAPPSWLRPLSLLLFGAALTVALVRPGRGRATDAPPAAILVAVAYAAYLLFFVTYPIYREYGAIDNTVNGRYLIPVYPLVVAFTLRHTIGLLPARASNIAGLALAVAFAASDLPHLLPRMSACWFVDVSPTVPCPY